ncbi:P-loop NTPase fold protein [Agaribacterium sp. ZY112]|uniref:KAP family P-loop NTPase fold protein n=1 Tax=Agaribacterium sp. ZY112 TaxID=3233574 RepID=UPI0035231606
MWTDNETDRDFLNFSTVAATVSEIIARANGQPVSIGVSGSWGVGKSSMIKLVQANLKNTCDNPNEKKYIFVEFNAWLYQGYDDAKAALMEVIARKLSEEAEQQQTAVGKTKDLLCRIDWLRAAKTTGGVAASLITGVPIGGLVGKVWDSGEALLDGEVTEEDLQSARDSGNEALQEGKRLVKPKKRKSPPQEIEAIRRGFESSLEELDVTLVVLIDDLDRCLPETAISTLEALRLFLFLKNTAFVIAADTKMIHHSVRKHFHDMPDDQLVTNYFDKLIQIPIQVPKLGVQDIKAYLCMLYIDLSDIEQPEKDKLRERICRQLSETWKGARVDRQFLEGLSQELNIEIPVKLSTQIDLADRLAPLMSSETAIDANPRLIKRFLNAISIRLAIGSAQDIAIDEAVLTKILLLERCGSDDAYKKIATSCARNDEGLPSVLKDIEASLEEGKEIDWPPEFDTAFFKQWAASKPQLADIDIRGALYVSREHSPLLLSHEQLSSSGLEILRALKETPDMANALKDSINELATEDLNLIMDKLLEIAAREQSWGAPDILTACVVVGQAHKSVGKRFGAFLSERPTNQIEPSIVPKIAEEDWVDIPFDVWTKSDVSGPVKKAIQKSKE